MERFFNGGRKAALAAGLMLASVGMLTNPVLAESALNDMIMESAPHVNRGHPTTILPPPPAVRHRVERADVLGHGHGHVQR